jgi:signal transduction histidine kinase
MSVPDPLSVLTSPEPTPRVRWWRRVALAAVVALVQVGITGMAAGHQTDDHGFGLAGVTLLLLASAAIPFRFRYPVQAYLVAFGATLTYWSLGYARGPVFFALIITLGHLVMIGRRRLAVAGLVAGYVGMPWFGYWVGRAGWPDTGFLVGLAAWLIALFSIAELVRSRRDRAEEAERAKAEATRRQVADERLRIARELHDVVAHNMSLISIQAGVALHLLDQNPEQARSSLATIKDASKEALVELRSILGVLRQVDLEGEPAVAVPGEDSDAPRAPVPTLERLGDLVERARAAGIDVQVEVGPSADDVSRLPRPVDLAAFRIVQESLTNVAKHSDDRAAVVRIRREGEGLALEVLDDGSGQAGGPGDPLPGAGTGIIGMRERAAAAGGRLTAGPRPGRGFAVRAWLPLDPEATGPDERAQQARQSQEEASR